MWLNDYSYCVCLDKNNWPKILRKLGKKKKQIHVCVCMCLCVRVCEFVCV